MRCLRIALFSLFPVVTKGFSTVAPLTRYHSTILSSSRRYHPNPSNRNTSSTKSLSHTYRPHSSSSALSTSPSGIDDLPILYQAGVFFGIYVIMAISTSQTIKVIDGFSKSVLGLEKWRAGFIDTSLPFLLGLMFLVAGVAHFTANDAFCQIYPPLKTWGIWYIPGSAQFHVAWTGIVEILGGSGLLLGAFQSLMQNEEDDDNFILKLVKPCSAGLLFILTILVTPANIYMYTHGALMGDIMPPLDLSFHYVRFIVQVLLLSQLFVLAKDSFFFAWGDELD